MVFITINPQELFDNSEQCFLTTAIIITLSSPFYNKTKLCDELSGNAETHNLSVQGLQGWIEFDTIQGKLSCNNGALGLNISEQNQMGLQLEAQYGLRVMSISGFVKPDATMPKQVHDAVKFLGRPDNNGRYSFKF